MVDGYMNNSDYKEVMTAEGLTSSRAVKLYLLKANGFFKQQELLKVAVAAHPNNVALMAGLKHADESRVENVWLAIETARAEKLQGWKYLEDGNDFVNTLLIKYEGDMTRCTHLEKLKTEYIEILEEEQQRQIKNEVKNNGA
ncbi:hypothetical protein GNY08_07075 [Levilactobacillus brevis]|uniref:hypothetical protein n=1 Tax=Levilactobacillus brevis TaxID=1580 RepID=UPI0018C024F2|nr:hypothetical protein [Levilactobacillus brevis]QOX67339.1 hypothetical protein GNY08_07075 [Levilactobacillus brevis]